MVAGYVTPAEVRAVLAPDGGDQPSTDPATAAELSDPILTQAITDAQSEVDARIAARYVLPLATVPPIIAEITCHIASYLASLTWRKDRDVETQRDPIALRYTRVRNLLESIVSGTIPLDVERVDSADVVNPYEGQLFTPDDFHLGYDHGCRGPYG